MDTKPMDKYKVLAGVILFGSLWGMLECILSEVSPPWFPGAAFLGGFVGLGLMMFTRRIYGAMWMQLGMAIVAGLVRFWSPVIGTCVICSALAIIAEGLIFELIFNRPVFNIHGSGPLDLKKARTLASLGIISGFTIFTVGFIMTQIMTPIVTGGIFSPVNLISNMPTYVGTGFFAAVFGGVAVPVAVLTKRLHLDLERIRVARYYGAAAGISAFCWALAFAFPYA
jgi:hypothetical protein